MPVFTTVIWLACLIAGLTGLCLHYAQVQAVKIDQPPVNAERLQVQLAGAAPVQSSVIDSPVQPQQPIPSPTALPALPGFTAMAKPAMEVPLAVPVVSIARQSQSPIAVEHLTFGSGDGDKPAPEYPREAKIARQQGTVRVQFIVDEGGHVQDVKAITPSAFSLLNQAAVRAVRDTWTFQPGKMRVYDVSFQFELH